MNDEALDNQSHTRSGKTATVDRYMITLIIAASVLTGAAILANGLKDALKEAAVPVSENGRWSVHQDLTDGWLMLDSANGRICQVPRDVGVQPVQCTTKPPEY